MEYKYGLKDVKTVHDELNVLITDKLKAMTTQSAMAMYYDIEVDYLISQKIDQSNPKLFESKFATIPLSCDSFRGTRRSLPSH